jgi:outer membrane protein assembly factor BamB
MVRCVTLKEGKHVWRFGDKKPGGIRVHHGITRTVPAVDGKFVFSLDPKGVFHCLDARTGKELWRKDVPAEYATLIPQWYVGQCPLVEPDRVVIAPGGRALFAAFDKATGNVLWETPDEEKTVMGHASVMPADIGGVKQYVHCNIKGAAAADANGRLLWRFPWKFNIVAPVSPLPIGDGRIFLTSCYEAVTVMIRVTREGDQFVAKKEFSLGEGGWNSEVHTPILFRDHLFAVGKKKNGLLTCLDLNGNIVWESGNTFFELGSYLLADRMLFVLEGKTGVLRLVEASTSGYRELDHAGVLHGKDVLGPMALSDGKLVLRDMTTMKCIQVGAP